MDQLKAAQIPDYQIQGDYFLYFCNQAMHAFQSAYMNASQNGNCETESYWRGKVDSYAEIMEHYRQLKGGQ